MVVFNGIILMTSSSEENTSSLSLASPFPNTIQQFDDGTSFPDFLLTIPGLEKPLHLHRSRLAQASLAFSHLFNGQELPFCTFDEENRCGKWADGPGAMENNYCSVLLKLLRFCYGEDQTFSADECPVAAEIAAQLEFDGHEEIPKRIEDFPKEASHLKSDRESLAEAFMDRHPEIRKGEKVQAIPRKYNYDERQMLAFYLAENMVPVKDLAFSRLDRGFNESFAPDANQQQNEYSKMICSFLKTNTTLTSLAVGGIENK